eukprot:TRINITY_DN2072_c0_g1_i11.p1 TRINITY_DN2072_c0_g1~~TRINITY_DN2072_c0_g1_i11.p1  ORF type:complete len:299 (-),score=58.39 TRINITY_DN2072_c0_g1_i11:14-910(-)
MMRLAETSSRSTHRTLADSSIDRNTGARYILVCIDHFSKYVWTFALDTKDKDIICKFLHDQFGEDPFEIYHSDNGGEFKNEVMETYVEGKLKKKLVHGRARHPQSQGAVERVNRTLKDRMGAMITEHDDWEWTLEDATRQYNAANHTTINMTPHLCERGEEDRELMRPLERKLYDTDDKPTREQIHQIANANTDKARRRMLARRPGAKTIVFEEGQIVFVKNEAVDRSIASKSTKWEEGGWRWKARIIQVSKNYRYKVQWLCAFSRIPSQLCNQRRKYGSDREIRSQAKLCSCDGARQ